MACRVASAVADVLAEGACCDQANVTAMLMMLMMMSTGGGEVQYRRVRGMCAQTMR